MEEGGEEAGGEGNVKETVERQRNVSSKYLHKLFISKQ